VYYYLIKVYCCLSFFRWWQGINLPVLPPHGTRVVDVRWVPQSSTTLPNILTILWMWRSFEYAIKY